MVGLAGQAGWRVGVLFRYAARGRSVGHFDVPCDLAPAADKGAATGAAVFVSAAAVALSFVRCAELCGVAVLRWPEIGLRLA